MRLRSDFHDYYDNALGYGIDDGIYYERFTKKVKLRLHTKLNWPTEVFGGVIGFCGRLYPFIEIIKRVRETADDGRYIRFRPVESYYAYNFDEYEAREKSWNTNQGWIRSGDKREIQKIRRFYKDWNIESGENFRDFRVPVFIVPRLSISGEAIINPRLADYGFDRVKDVVTAFQEISVYLANVLVEQKPVAAIEDRYRIEQHGFDLKASFRKKKQG